MSGERRDGWKFRWQQYHREWEHGLTQSELLVVLALVSWADLDGVTIVGQQRVARYVGLSERHVRRCLRAAEERGSLVIERRAGRPSRYQLAVAGQVGTPDTTLSGVGAAPRTDPGHSSARIGRTPESATPDTALSDEAGGKRVLEEGEARRAREAGAQQPTTSRGEVVVAAQPPAAQPPAPDEFARHVARAIKDGTIADATLPELLAGAGLRLPPHLAGEAQPYWDDDPARVARCAVNWARRQSGHTPPGPAVFLLMLRDGDNPPLPKRSRRYGLGMSTAEILEVTGNGRPGDGRPTRRSRSRVCPECEVSEPHHAADCSRAPQGAAS